MPSGLIEKLKILPFSDEDCTIPAGAPFVAMLNPTSFNMKYEVETTKTPTEGGAQHNQFKGLKLGEFSIDLLVDDTGALVSQDVLPLYGGVVETIEFFKNTCYKINGTEHIPNYLQVAYGAITYSCQLRSFSVAFTLFARNGRPLRAKITASFQETKSVALQNIIAQKNSPDLTHKRVLRQFETLVGLSNNIYKRNDLYQQVARVNGLNNFRRSKNGSALFFPPLSKS